MATGLTNIAEKNLALPEDVSCTTQGKSMIMAANLIQTDDFNEKVLAI